MTPPRGIALADSVTALGAEHAGCVLVSGSHGGIVAARYAARAAVRAVIFNDAGIGCDEAGVAGLAWLARLGIAAAAVAHDSARIADASDGYANGRISRANALAVALGVGAGEPCARAAQRLLAAAWSLAVPDARSAGEGRFLLAAGDSGRSVILGLDSIGLVREDDARRVLVIGSHGGLHGGDPASALPVDARAAFFHDAGIGRDGAGTTRLPVLDARGILAATVDYRSARIGDARSLWTQGTLSVVNAAMRRAGVAPGMTARKAAGLCARRD